MADTTNIVEALRQKLISDAEACWRTLTENSLSQIMFLDPEGTILYSNRSLQIADCPDDLIGKSLFEHVSEANAELLNEAFEKAFSKRQPATLELKQMNKDGERLVFESRIFPVIEQNKVIALITDTRDITEHRHEHDTLEQKHAFLDTVIANSPIIIWALDDKGVFTLSEGKGLEELGFTAGEVVGHSVFDIYQNHPDVINHSERALNGEEVRAIVRVQNRTFQTIHTPVINDNREVTSVIGVAYDITTTDQIETQMHIISAALEQTTDVVLVTDANGIAEYVNPAFEATTGYSQDEIIGHNPNLLNSGRQDKAFYKNMWDTLLNGENFSDVFINKRKDGSIYYEEKTITPVRDYAGEITHFISTGKDISERMRTQERLHYMAHHDALTKLPNRNLFLDRLRQAMARASWHNRLIAVIFMDLDHFKDVNDSHGHEIGDMLLVQMTQRLITSVRAGDTVARFGGDEFAILLDDVASEKDVSQLAKKMLDTLVMPFHIKKHNVRMTASLGVSIFPSDGDDSETLLRNADVAMYRAKHMGKNNYQFFSNEMSARAFQRLSLENSLRHALKRGEFFLEYQPQVDSRTGKLTAVEALLRWQHPELGVVSPTDFVPILEESGLIVSVGEWVLTSACKQAVEWHRQGHEHLMMCVNLSSRQFDNPDFIQSFHSIIAETGIEPQRLELELTESMLMRNASKTISALNTLSHIGVQIAVDDFGTGYSSLNYLRRFPIATIKIDRSFIQDVLEDTDDAAITTAIIVMAQSLNLNVVAEGVESEAQLNFLHKHNCYEIQGNYYHDTLPADEISRILAEASDE